ncbi:MAG: lamin tail domain-containing protein, partial [Desulfobacterales bacterium]|nr:lamin tail domain-containing protein [Desulfobacterales bacterium]
LGPADIVDGGTHNPPVVPEPIPNLPESNIPSSVRIIGAKINPKGHDPGLEKIILVNTGADDQPLTGWCLKDKNNNSHVFKDDLIAAGEFLPVPLSGHDIQLSNKGGSIRLFDSNEHTVHKVNYSKAQAKTQGITVLF